MTIEAKYETKLQAQREYTESISYMNVSGEVVQDGKFFSISLTGNEAEVDTTLRSIMELSFLYDGYFYTPIKYVVDGNDTAPESLYFLQYYKTGNSWKDAASPLYNTKMEFTTERIEAYEIFRNQGRDQGKLVTNMLNAFYYLHSEGYERININHRLSLFLNICDGFIINTVGPSKNVMANISNVLKGYLDVNLIKYGAGLLGLPQNKVFEALRDERNEIDHYALQIGKSVSNYVHYSTDERAYYINMFYIYIIELALRVAFLDKIGFQCPNDRKEYATNEINDWLIIQCNLPDRCKNPRNQLTQDLRAFVK